MSVLSTRPVVRCRYCGRPLEVAELYTLAPDEGGELLLQLLRSLSEKAICKTCRRRRDYLILSGRADEFHERSIQ